MGGRSPLFNVINMGREVAIENDNRLLLGLVDIDGLDSGGKLDDSDMKRWIFVPLVL